MLRINFEKGNRGMFYHVIVKYDLNGEHIEDDIVLLTKASKDAVYSALRASTKYDIVVSEPCVKNPTIHCDIECLDSACNWLNRVRFYNIQKKVVEKVIQVVETETVEL